MSALKTLPIVQTGNLDYRDFAVSVAKQLGLEPASVCSVAVSPPSSGEYCFSISCARIVDDKTVLDAVFAYGANKGFAIQCRLPTVDGYVFWGNEVPVPARFSVCVTNLSEPLAGEPGEIRITCEKI
ncbi:MAG: hypothetical protein AAB511_01205 [Patescibacteria group bacterium]